MVRREAQLLVNYRDSEMVGGTADSGSGHGPHPGDRAPDCRGLQRAQVNFPLRLFELLADPHHTLLLYADETGPAPDLAGVEDVLTTVTGGRARTYLITPDPGLSVAGLPVIVDAAGEFRDTYGAVGGSGYLVRPDGYLGFRAAPLTATALRRHLERMFAPAPVPAQYDIRPGGDGGVPPVRALPRGLPLRNGCARAFGRGRGDACDGGNLPLGHEPCGPAAPGLARPHRARGTQAPRLRQRHLDARPGRRDEPRRDHLHLARGGRVVPGNVRANAANQAAVGVELVDIRLLEVQASAA